MMESNVVKKIELSELVQIEKQELGCNIELIHDLQVELDVKIGGASISVDNLFSLKRGSVVCIDKQLDDPVEIMLNNKIIARGYLVSVGEHFGIEVIEVE